MNGVDESKLTDLQLLFLEAVRKWLDTVTAVEWQVKPRGRGKSYCYDVEVHPDSPGSLPVIASAEPKEIIMFFTEYWHHHFDPAIEGSLEEVVSEASSFLEAATSGDFKVVVKKSSGKPYIALSYIRREGKWRSYGSVEIRLILTAVNPLKKHVEIEELMNSPGTPDVASR